MSLIKNNNNSLHLCYKSNSTNQKHFDTTLAVDKAMPEQIKQFEEEVHRHVEEESGER